MKQIGSFTRKLVAGGVALLATSLLFEVHAQAWSEGRAEVRAVRGSAQYSTGGGVWVPLRPNMTLHAGSSIRTAAESTVDLDLGPNGPALRVGPVTTMALDRLAFRRAGRETVAHTELNLLSGELLGNFAKAAEATRYEVKTPNAVAGIRGSKWRTRTQAIGDGQIQSEFNCIEGLMVIADASDPGRPAETVRIETGQTYITGIGIRPTPPALQENYRRQIDDIIVTDEVTVPTAPEPITFIEPQVSPVGQ